MWCLLAIRLDACWISISQWATVLNNHQWLNWVLWGGVTLVYILLSIVYIFENSYLRLTPWVHRLAVHKRHAQQFAMSEKSFLLNNVGRRRTRQEEDKCSSVFRTVAILTYWTMDYCMFILHSQHTESAWTGPSLQFTGLKGSDLKGHRYHSTPLEVLWSPGLNGPELFWQHKGTRFRQVILISGLFMVYKK